LSGIAVLPLAKENEMVDFIRSALSEVQTVPSRPVIGIATQTLDAVPGELPACWIMGQTYVRVLQAAGAVPWLIPLIPEDADTMREVYDRLDGVFLTGGVDVDPSCYGEVKQSFCGRTDRPRDEVEMQLVRWALADEKPVLAVCRGIQIVNVALGGSLYQDVKQQLPNALRHDYFPTKDNPSRDFIAHSIVSQRGTRLGHLFGVDPVPVNSMHHQAIRQLGPDLVASAVAPDGIIEGVEGANGHYLVAVQWHPEELVEQDKRMRALFASFVEESRNVR
jgi:putative glutamine amidotransferase